METDKNGSEYSFLIEYFLYFASKRKVWSKMKGIFSKTKYNWGLRLVKIEAIHSEYLLVCKNLQANISLNGNFAKFCDFSLQNKYFEVNNRQFEKSEANICYEANIRFNMYLFCIKSSICIWIFVNILTRIPSGESIWGSRSKKDRLLNNQWR